MSGPFIFIATNRLKPGKLDEEKARVPSLVDFVEANEPRLIAFNEYANEDGTEVAVVQVHPDADSMAFHMEVVAERAAACLCGDGRRDDGHPGVRHAEQRRRRNVATAGRSRRAAERQAAPSGRDSCVVRAGARDRRGGAPAPAD